MSRVTALSDDPRRVGRRDNRSRRGPRPGLVFLNAMNEQRFNCGDDVGTDVDTEFYREAVIHHSPGL